MALPLIPATEEQLRKINIALSVDENRHNKVLEAFKDWIKSEPYLPEDVDEKYLSNFLALCKGDLLKAKKKFEINIIGRKRNAYLSYETFLTAENMRRENNARLWVPLPKLTIDGYRIIWLSFPRAADRFDLKNTLKYGITIADINMLEDYSAGVTALGDFSNCNFELVTKLDLAIVAQFARFLLNAYPLRLKNCHILNAPAAAKPIIAVIKSILPEKMIRRVITHDTVESLKDYFDEGELPVEYGGKLPTLDDLAKSWETYQLENEDYKDKLRKLRVTGEIPKDKLHWDSSYGFGTDGTFRNLQVD